MQRLIITKIGHDLFVYTLTLTNQHNKSQSLIPLSFQPKIEAKLHQTEAKLNLYSTFRSSIHYHTYSKNLSYKNELNTQNSNSNLSKHKSEIFHLKNPKLNL